MELNRLIDRLRNRTAAFAHDIVMIPLAWVGALWLRFNLGEIPSPHLEASLAALPVVVLLQGAAAWSFGLYRGVWRFASVPDLIRILKAIAIGVCATYDASSANSVK